MTVPLDDTRPTDWTPERHAAAKVRDAEAPKGPWGVFEQDCLCWITGPTCIIGNEGQMSRSVAAFVAHAREDLPAALVEIERLGDVVSKIVKQHLALANDADRLREEIERLTAELAARAPADCDHRAGGEVSIAGTCADCGVDFADLPDVAPADASLEAAKRTWRGEWQRIAADIRSMSEAGKTPADILAILLTHLDMMKPLAVVRAVDASRPPPADEDTRPRLTERDADDIELARAVRDTLREVTHAGAIERLEELLDVEKEAAVRPGLTEEQARRDFEASIRDAVAKGGPYGNTHAREAVAALDAALRASRGETGPAADPRATLHAGDPASPFAPGSLAAGSATEDRILDRKRGGK